MTNKLDIETRLDRSLQNQVAAPRLDGRFDAAVWKRIAAEEQRARQPVVSAGTSTAGLPRWMLVTNLIGVSVAVLLAIYFGMKAFTGVNVDVNVDVPQIAPAAKQVIVAVSVQVVTLAALIFGLMFTPLGRRLKSVFT
jgi:predicted secreted protein